MKYDIKRLRTDKNYFDAFKSELPSEFKKHTRNVDEFIKYFDLKNTSREIYYNDIDWDATDKQIYDDMDIMGIDASEYIELSAYTRIKGNDYEILLHGTNYLEHYDDEHDCYADTCFGDYEAIEIL